MGFCHHPFFNYQTARRGERQPCCLFRFILYNESRDPLTAYRERAMEVLLQDCTGQGHACYQTVRRLSSLSLQPNPDDDDDDDGCCCFLNIIIIHLLHSHIHCDLDHSCSKLTLHDLHFFLNPRSQNFPPPREISLHLHIHTVGNTAFFKSPAIFSYLPPEGREVT